MGLNGQIVNQVRHIIDAAGRVIGYRNLASDQDEAMLTASQVAAVVAGTVGAGKLWIGFGHSFMDQESYGAGWSALGTLTWANAQLPGRPLTIARAAGIGGYRMLDLVHYWQAIGAALNPAGVVVSMGHNDLKGLYPSGNASAEAVYPQIGADTQQTHLPYLLDTLREWIDTVEPSTTIVLLGESVPGQDPTGASTTVTAQLAVRFQQWNRGLMELERVKRNVIYVPADKGTIDATSTVGKNIVGTFWDQTHPSIIGGYKRSKQLLKAIANRVPVGSDPLPYSAADTHSAAALTTSSVPIAAGGTLTIPISNGSSTLKTIEVGDMVQLQPVGTTAADKLLAGRYEVLTASTTDITAACSATATASANMKVSMSKQLFINPLMLTTTGGNAGGFSNSGTISGALPLGVDVINLPVNWTATFTFEPHLVEPRDIISAVTLSLATVGASRTATAVDGVWQRSDIGKMLISGAGIATVTGITDAKVAVVTITTAFAGTSLAAGAVRVGERGFGNVLRMDLTSGGAGAAGSFSLVFQASQKSASPAGYDVFRKAHFGTTYQAGLDYEQSSVVGGYNGAYLQLYWRLADVATETAGSNYALSDLYRDTATIPNTTNFSWPTDDLRLTYLTPEATPVDTTSGNFLESLQTRMTFFLSGANASATIRIGRAGIWAVDSPAQVGSYRLY